MTFVEYLHNVHVYYVSVEDQPWRAGQTYFNVLHRVRPDLSEAVRSTMRDPFYNDNHIPALLSFLAQNWDNQTANIN